MNYGITIVNIHKDMFKLESRASKPGPPLIMDHAIHSLPFLTLSVKKEREKKKQSIDFQ